MSSNTINSQANDNDQAAVQAPKGKVTLSKDELFTSSVAVMNTTASQVVESFGSAQTAPGSFDAGSLTTFLMIQEQQRKEEKANEKQKLFFEEIVTEAGEGKGKSQGSGNTLTGESQTSDTQQSQAPTGEDAIFQAAGLTSDVESQSQESLTQQLENDLQIMQTELEAMEQAEQDWINLEAAWKKYQEHPNQKNFNALAQAWQTASKDTEAIQNPGIYADFQTTSQESFKKRMQDLVKVIEEVQQLVAILEGGGKSSLFTMEALLMDLEKTAVKNNSDQATQQATMAQAAIEGLQETENKLKDALKKLEKSHHKSHGLFGFVKDLFKSILKSVEHLVEGLADVVAGAVTGNAQLEKKGFSELYKASGLKSIIDAIGEIVKGIATGNLGEIAKGFETLATAVVLTLMFGPEGLALMDTSFGKDIKDMVKLVTDAVVALVEVVGAGLLAYVGDDKDAKSLLNDAKKLGIQMLENPMLQTLAEAMMVVMIIAAVVSGQFWLAAILTVVFVMTESGLMGDATNGLTKMFEAMGVSDSWAKVLADITVIVIITALSFGAGSVSAAGDVAADDGAEAGAQMGQQASEELEMTTVTTSEETASETATTTTSRVATVAAHETQEEIVDEIVHDVEEAGHDASESASHSSNGNDSEGSKSIGERIGTRGGMTLMGLGTSLGSSSLAMDLAKAIDKNSEALEIILMIVQEAMAAIACAGGGAGISSTEGLSGIDQRAASLMEKVAPKFIQYLQENSAELTTMAFRLQQGAMATSSVASGMMAGDKLIQASIVEAIGKLKADVALFTEVNTMNNAAITQNNTHLKELMKEFDQIVDTFDAPALASQGINQALMQNM